MDVFISHSSADDAFVADLRRRLEDHGLSPWVDSRDLRGGDRLDPAIEQAIRGVTHFIVVLSPQTINSSWVRKEIRIAEAVARDNDQYRLVPLLLEGVEPGALEMWFKQVPLAITIDAGSAGLDQALPAILAALGRQLPDDPEPLIQADERPLADLLLKLGDPSLRLKDGKQRLKATATLIYQPADPRSPAVESKRYGFTAPLGPIEAEDLRWYLERYYIWPVGLFRERAEGIEAKLPVWGRALFTAALASDVAREPLQAWFGARHAAAGQAGDQAAGLSRRFSIQVDELLPEGAAKKRRENAVQAATALIGLPWELLHNGDGDGDGWLFQGGAPVAVRRRLPNRRDLGVLRAELPIRILLVSPRPEDEQAGYIDHRVSARALVDAVAGLGDLVELTVLDPPTFPALGQALKAARERGQAIDVLHFDGHGVFDREHGLGALCFEAPAQPGQPVQLEGRATALVHADQLAATLRDQRVPLVFLEACQSAHSDQEPTASVAAKLLEQGCSAVVAMGYSVLVETARRFTAAFYGGLAQGRRVGEAFLDGQIALHDDAYRIEVMGAGRLELQDWFVPVLYQEAQDPLLFTRLPNAEYRRLLQQRRACWSSNPTR